MVNSLVPDVDGRLGPKGVVGAAERLGANWMLLMCLCILVSSENIDREQY